MKKLAFLILAHNDSVHLSKLIKALNYNSDFYVHIDKKTNIKEFQDRIPLKNVFFLENRITVSWAGISMVDALFELIHEVLKCEIEYSHAVFITGSCYPIKSIKTIYEEFISNPEKEYINFIDMRDSPEHYIKLIKQKWFKEPIFHFKNKHLINLDKCIRFLLNKLKLKNHWGEKIIPYTGHTWCALTMNCCKYVYEYHRNNPWFREMNRFTMAADEHYIHTIIGNSFFKPLSLGVTKYKGRGLYQYTSIYLIDKSLVKWYDLNDWKEIKASDKLFIRKVNSQTGNELVTKINNELF
ncbi:hypothetical protein GM418_05720 [Maribellus comscasis]|uniref:Peptide O-xylosyltransferase n=1 Tax=Maribellus comscasis TaxID=2681766 RepID=A0A6I6JUU4_9BACT|nr:beta-1,6-N-acetylglucosaminyltransferase [Maribellus comscasis]QGY43173.1 hypothetical protein GM418_05720 [Maribellus comscasis]